MNNVFRQVYKMLCALLVVLPLIGCDSASAPNPAVPKAPSLENSPSNSVENKAEVGSEPASPNPPSPDPATPTVKSEAPVEMTEDEKKARGIGATPADQPQGATRHYGSAFTLDSKPLPLAKALERVDGDRVLKVNATVEKVCKVKGCWFTLTATDVDAPVRVKMKDYGFFVPRNTRGAEATLEGTLEKRIMPLDEAQHYAKDEGRDPNTVTEPQPTYEFEAHGVELRM